MEFVPNCKPYLKFALNYFTKFKLDLSDSQKSKQAKHMERLFNNLKNGEKYVKKFMQNPNSVFIDIIPIENITQITKTSLHNSHYFPKEIQNDIYKNVQYKIRYDFSYFNIDYIIEFYTYETTINRALYNNYFTKILIWLYVVNQHISRKCSDSMNIVIFLSPFKKKIPENNLLVLNTINANTALTYPCARSGQILIYRQQEWFKVFIHETFHSFNLDFSTMAVNDFNNNIKKIFPIKSAFNITESYTEFWASVMNCVFASYFSLNKSRKFETFMLYIEFTLQIERIFSLYQCNKVLKYMGLTYLNLYNKNDEGVAARHLYKEKTNIFAYYVIKTILMYDYIDFIEWCSNNNSDFFQFANTQHNLHKLYKYIKTKHNNPDFLKDIAYMSTIEPSKSSVLKTMRLTAIEFI